ncbi:hypothetical protein [uncultured Azohydromonas sp.]|jgi:hypothetical protein|uniref:hypothetical protein n=1 Tax=uncultured Azohydromonas sp. TaxID=487342 RepID=UPI00262AFB35|nr:hypothetical protein [uncultured Azohydromonas sp.]
MGSVSDASLRPRATDVLDATRRLRDAGFDEQQAETLVRVLADAQPGLVTREHFDARIEQLEARLEAKLTPVKWGMGLVVAGVAAQLVKTFFGRPWRRPLFRRREPRPSSSTLRQPGCTQAARGPKTMA